MMSIVNSLSKDSRWLQLEVCREFQRNKCSRPDSECKFAHPPPTVEVQNGRVVACYDSIKGRCSREKPPCKYFHPPQHLKDQLLINGRNHLALKQALMQTQLTHMPVLGTQLPVTGPVSASILAAFAGPSRLHHESRLQRRKETVVRTTGVGIGSFVSPLDSYAALRKQASSNLNPYHQMASAQMAAAAAAAAYGSYPHPLTLIPSLMSAADQLTNHYHGVMPTAAPAVSALIKTPAQRTDRLEICREYLRGNCKRPDSDCRFAHPPDHIQVDPGDGLVTVCMDFLKGRCSRDSCRYLHPPAHLQAQLKSRTSNSVVASASTEPGSAVSFATPASSLLPNLLPQHLANNRSPFRL